MRTQSGTCLSWLWLFLPVIFFALRADESQTANPAQGGHDSTIVVHLPGLPKHARPLEMVLIPAGSFMMGCGREGQNSESSFRHRHEVKITKPFYIGKAEITQAQYEALRGARSNHSIHKGPDLPVEKASWYDTQIFLNKLNRLNQGKFRLPTEAEWEYACLKSGQYSLENMTGGLAEWCDDKWRKACPKNPQIDPRNRGTWLHYYWPLTNRVVRGGADRKNGESAMVHRGYEQSADYHYSIGFRIVRESD